MIRDSLLRAKRQLERAELSVGRVQHAVIRESLSRSTGLKARFVPTRNGVVPVLSRRARDGKAPLLLIHGFGGNKETWLLMLAYLPRTCGLILLDLPGFGAAPRVDPQLTTAKAQVGVIEDVLDDLGVSRVHAVGTSMGGAITLRLARDLAERVVTLTLIASLGPRAVNSDLGKALEAGENPFLPSELSQGDEFLSLVAAKAPRVPRAVTRYVTSIRIDDAPYLETLFPIWLNAWTDDGVPTALSSIGQPALVIHGTLDRVIDVEVADILGRELPQATVKLLPMIGHLPPLEAPRDTARLISEFVALH